MALYRLKHYQRVAYVSATASTSTASTSDVLMDGMSIDLTGVEARSYWVSFSASGACSSATANATYGIAVDGTSPTLSSIRNMNDTGAAATASMFTGMNSQIYTFAPFDSIVGFHTIAVYYKTEAGTFTVRERSLVVFEI